MVTCVLSYVSIEKSYYRRRIKVENASDGFRSTSNRQFSYTRRPRVVYRMTTLLLHEVARIRAIDNNQDHER